MFVGRASELDALAQLEEYARRGETGTAVIVGDPGAGKTRLLDQLIQRLQLPVRRLHGYEPSREIAFSAATPFLRGLARVPGVGPQLDALLFGAAGKGPGENLRIFEAALRCLQAQGEMAVVVDDAQWIDRETLGLFHHLVAASADARLPLVLICASRPAQEPRALAEAWAYLLPESRRLELRLGPLGQNEGVQLACALAPGISSRDGVELWRRAQGSPFWLEALARSRGMDISPESLLRDRFSGLGADPARLFALLVAAARPLGLTDLSLLLDWPESRVKAASAGLIKQALTIAEGDSLRVAHDLLREAAERNLPGEDARRLHGRLSAWLEGIAGGDLDILSRALEHRRSARLDAGDLALRIARLPQRRLLGRAGLEVLASVASETIDADALQLQEAIAGLASELGEWSIALTRWSELVDRLPTPAARARAALAAAEAAVRLEQPEVAYQRADRARSLGGADRVVAIEADVREGQALRWLENRVGEAQQRTERAVAGAQQLVAERGGSERLDALELRAYVGALRADLDSAIRTADADKVSVRAAEIVASAREPAEVLAASFDAIFSLLMFEGLANEAEPRARSALAEARRLVLPTAEVEANHWLGWALRLLGRLEEAEDVTRQTVVLVERVGSPARFSAAVVRSIALSVQASRGDWRPAVEAIAAQAAAETDPHYRLNVRFLHLLALLRFSDPDSLSGELVKMRADAEAAGCDRCWWEYALLSAEARTRAGDDVRARAELAEWDRGRPNPRPGPAARRVYIQALLESHGDPEGSQSLFERAAEIAAGAGQNLMRLSIELDRALATVPVDRAAAVERMRSAAELAGVMGAVSEQQLAARSLRELGVRWHAPAASRSGVLSERELKIAAMVAAGASNPEIAQSLFLSRKTVERHVSHILAKLRLRNRVELAAHAQKEGLISK